MCPLDLVRISSHQPVTPSHCCPVIVVCNSATETYLIVLTTQTDTWPGKPVCATPVEKPSKERCHSPYPCPVEQVTTRNGRTGLTRQFIRYGMMATVPHGYPVRRADFAPVGQWKSTGFLEWGSQPPKITRQVSLDGCRVSLRDGRSSQSTSSASCSIGNLHRRGMPL